MRNSKAYNNAKKLDTMSGSMSGPWPEAYRLELLLLRLNSPLNKPPMTEASARLGLPEAGYHLECIFLMYSCRPVLHITSSCSKRKDKYVEVTTKIVHVGKEEYWLDMEHSVERKTSKMSRSYPLF